MPTWWNVTVEGGARVARQRVESSRVDIYEPGFTKAAQGLLASYMWRGCAA
jgi:hypothetical protein